MTRESYPPIVEAALRRAERAGFTMSCDDGTGRLLAVLAAAVPTAGRVLELGTGVGFGTAWIVHGLQHRDDVQVITVEHDAAVARLAADAGWPAWVGTVRADALEILRGRGEFDLIFADAPAGKWEALDLTVAALRPGGHLLVDDMTPPEFVDEHHERKTREARERLVEHPALICVEIGWATGLILTTRLTA